MIITNDKSYIQSRFGSGSTPVSSDPEDMVAFIGTDAISGFSFTTESTSLDDYPEGNQSGQVDASVQGFLTNAKTYGNDMSNLLKDFSGTSGKDSILISNNSISNSSAITIKSTTSDATLGSMNIKVDQLASGQINRGGNLSVLGNDFGAASEQEFRINVGGSNYSLAFSTTESDNNLSILQKMAKTINDMKLGVSAEVKYNSSTQETSLRLLSDKIGATQDGSDLFTVSDVSGQAASIAGITTTTEKSKDAVYRFNIGEIVQSSSNTISHNGVTMQLNKTTSDNVIIGTEKQFDDSNLAQHTNEIVNSYNKLFGSVNANRNGDRLLEGLANQFSSIVSENSEALKKLGITQNVSGYLEFDASRAQDEGYADLLKSFFNKSNEDKNSFVSKLLDINSKIQENPTKFVEDINLRGVMGQTYNTPGSDAYNSFKEMQIQFKGVLLDIYK